LHGGFALGRPWVIDLSIKFDLVGHGVSQLRVTGDGHEASQASLQVKFDEFESPRPILLDSEQELFDSVHQNHVHSLAVEQICEEKLDRSAVVKHRALLHDLVHSLEDDIFSENLFLKPLFEGHQLQGVDEGELEYLVAGRVRRRVERVEAGLVVVAHDELVDQDDEHGAPVLSLIFAHRHDHQILHFLAQIQRVAHLVDSRAVFGCLIHYHYLLGDDRLSVSA